MSSPKRLIIAPAARRDIIAISHYSAETWGNVQAARYRQKIEGALGRIAHNPLVGANRPDLSSTYRLVPVESHVIVYRIIADTVEVVRILHRRMNRENHL